MQRDSHFFPSSCPGIHDSYVFDSLSEGLNWGQAVRTHTVGGWLGLTWVCRGKNSISHAKKRSILGFTSPFPRVNAPLTKTILRKQSQAQDELQEKLPTHNTHRYDVYERQILEAMVDNSGIDRSRWVIASKKCDQMWASFLDMMAYCLTVCTLPGSAFFTRWRKRRFWVAPKLTGWKKTLEGLKYILPLRVQLKF